MRSCVYVCMDSRGRVPAPECCTLHEWKPENCNKTKRNLSWDEVNKTKQERTQQGIVSFIQ